MNSESLLDGSAIGRAYRRVTSGVATAIEGSRMRALAGTVARKFDVAAGTSRVARAGATLSRWVRGSFLFRWLTAEPDPEVIVIDLRETHTVGPILAALDWLIRGLAKRWRGSIAQRATAGVRATVARQPVRVVSIVILVALGTEALLSALLGAFSPVGVGVRLLGAALLLVGTRVRLSWAELTETTPYRLLAAALAPPEPPESRSEDGDDV